MTPIHIYSHLFKKEIIYREREKLETTHTLTSLLTFYPEEVPILTYKNPLQLQKDILLVKETLGGEVIQ